MREAGLVHPGKGVLTVVASGRTLATADVAADGSIRLDGKRFDRPGGLVAEALRLAEGTFDGATPKNNAFAMIKYLGDSLNSIRKKHAAANPSSEEAHAKQEEDALSDGVPELESLEESSLL